jgi:hypothetical protein
LCLTFADADVRAQCAQGAWKPAFDHAANTPSGTCDPSFPWLGSENAVHMSLIPKGPRQGWILMWPHDFYTGDPSTQTRIHRWALLNPAAPISATNPENYCMPLPHGMGDLFCAGHAWNGNGDLLVVGGTGARVGPEWGGSKLAYLWVPPDGVTTPPGGDWQRLADLDKPLWYPSVVALGPFGTTPPYQDRMLVAGGTDFGIPANSYQVWMPTGGVGSWQQNPVTLTNTFAGPPGGSSYALGNYPRTVLMSGGAEQDLARVMTAGMVQGSDRVSHYAAPGVWLNPSWLQGNDRIYGTSVLLPISPGGILKDWVISAGGLWWQGPPPGTYFIEKTVQVTNGGGRGPGVWTSAPSMTYKRWLCNSVLTPDSRLIVFGGEQEWPYIDCSEIPAFVPERFDLQTGTWASLLADEIVRTYHSTSVLLPSGEVLTGGGDRRKFLPEVECCCNLRTNTPNPLSFEDYRVFVPGYIQCNNIRPVITNAAPPGSAIICTQGGTCDITYQNLPFPLTVDKVVLLRPGSVTHHADTNQRCVELSFSVDLPIGGSDALVTATIPTKNSGLLPRGYYLLFLVTNERVPSHGAWVRVQ